MARNHDYILITFNKIVDWFLQNYSFRQMNSAYGSDISITEKDVSVFKLSQYASLV